MLTPDSAGPVRPLDLGALRELALGAVAAPLLDGSASCLLLDLAACAAGAADAELRAWLRAQPAPVIGVGRHDGSGLADALDLCVERVGDAERVVGNVARNPSAAACLVQVLRVTEKLPVLDALAVESFAYATLQAGEEHRKWQCRPRAGTKTRHAAAPGESPVRLARHGDSLEIVLDRPERRNSMSAAMRDALCEAFDLVLMDESVRIARVSGAGDCFSVGGELDEFGSARDSADAHRIRSLRLPAALVARDPQRFTFHLHRACVGAGIELPSFASRVTAAKHTFFQLPELGMGLIPGAGGCVGIPRRIGRQRTAWWVLSGRRIDAATALAWGLVDAIV